jgi:hypothetical protein
MDVDSGFVMSGRESPQTPTVLWSVVALGLLSACGLWVAMALGMAVGTLLDGLRLDDPFITSLGSAFDRMDSAGYELFIQVTDVLLIACAALVAARHALHSPKLHGFLVAASILAVNGWMADELLESSLWWTVAVSAATLLLATLAGGLATRLPDSSRSVFAMLVARLRARHVPG